MAKMIGIHHITAIVNDPQINFDFYSNILGLRLVKKTVNFDRPEVYHLYFGNETADPGTIITFFPWPDLKKGRVGIGQVQTTGYIIPPSSSEFWKNRLEKFDVTYTVTNRFNETYIQFEDPDGLKIELVEREADSENSWTTEEISKENAIVGFSGATLTSKKPDSTKNLLESVFGLDLIGEENGHVRFRGTASIGNIIDIDTTEEVRGLSGAGTVHHIAWRAKDVSELEEWKKLAEENGYKVTEIKDRNYFKALYFREEGGILHEIATDAPGFTVDEDLEELGTHLMLPSWFEPRRAEFEAILPPINVKK